MKGLLALAAAAAALLASQALAQFPPPPATPSSTTANLAGQTIAPAEVDAITLKADGGIFVTTTEQVDTSLAMLADSGYFANEQVGTDTIITANITFATIAGMDAGQVTIANLSSPNAINSAVGFAINGSQKLFTGNAGSGSLDLRGNAAASGVAVGIGNVSGMTTGDSLAVYSDSFSTKVMHVVGDGTILTSSTKTSGTCTLNAASPSVCTAAVTAATHCGCYATGTTAASAIAVAASLSSSTLTCTGPNGSSVVVNYHCF